MSKDPINGVWISELNYLVPRAYTFTPYWNETADPALNKALQTVLHRSQGGCGQSHEQCRQRSAGLTG